MLERGYPDILYILRKVKGVDYNKFMTEIKDVFLCFDIDYEERDIEKEGDCLVIEITPTWELHYKLLYASLNVLFCTFRCVDYEFKSYYNGVGDKNMCLYDAVEFYIKKKQGDANHGLNENLHALWDSVVLSSAIKVFFNTIRLALGEEIPDAVMNSPQVKAFYERRYMRGQTPCYDLMEKIVDYTKGRHTC